MKFIAHLVVFHFVLFADFVEHLAENILSVPVRTEIRRQVVQDIVVLNLQCLQMKRQASVSQCTTKGNGRDLCIGFMRLDVDLLLHFEIFHF